MTTLATIGVHGLDAPDFLALLRGADVSLLVDVRQRRGVRGADHAWANSRRLQALLADAGIAYRHERSLAPTTELRQLQYAADALAGVGKRTRTQLCEAYIARYTQEILDPAPLDALVDALPAVGSAALLCVEREASACHRGLVAARLADRVGLDVVHLGGRGAGAAQAAPSSTTCADEPAGSANSARASAAPRESGIYLAG